MYIATPTSSILHACLVPLDDKLYNVRKYWFIYYVKSLSCYFFKLYHMSGFPLDISTGEDDWLIAIDILVTNAAELMNCIEQLLTELEHLTEEECGNTSKCKW